MKLLIRLAIIASLGILMANCSDKKSGETTNEKVAVKSMTVEKGPIAPSDSYIGNVVESQSSTLSFEVPGNIKEVLVKEGQKVAKGQLLAILNKGNIANNYWIAASTLKQAQDNYNRTAMLYQNKSIPQIQYVDAKTQLSKAKYAEQAAKKDLNDCYLYAPFSGIIGERSIEPGMNGIVFATVSIPLSDFWGGSYAMKKQKIKEQIAYNKYEQGKQLLLLEMKQAQNDFDESYRQVNIAKSAIAQSIENLRLYNNYLTAGTTEISQVLDAESMK